MWTPRVHSLAMTQAGDRLLVGGRDSYPTLYDISSLVEAPAYGYDLDTAAALATAAGGFLVPRHSRFKAFGW